MRNKTNPKKAKLTFKQSIAQYFINVISLYVAINLINSTVVYNNFAIFIAVFYIQVLLWIFTPFFEFFIKHIGITAILITSLFGNAFIVWFALSILDDISVPSFWSGFATAWVFAALTTLFNWILVSQSDDVFLTEIVRHYKPKKVNKTSKKGFIFVQLDGVSAPVLDWQLKAGNLPNIAKLLESEYVYRRWHTGLPSTTPASQAGILLGSNDNIPAFRWYEKAQDELVVANQQSGAKLIEKRLSTGNGLLVDGGVSVGNLFSGDATKNVMVMSKIKGNNDSVRGLSEYRSYFLTSYGFMRSFVLSIGEMIKEIYQARKQASRDMKPRIKRHGSYIFLRAATNVFMRDIQTNIVIHNMLSGTNSLYVDYLDYDEVAHHAGIARAESLASLSGLDRVIGILTRAKQYAPRPYEIVFVSDHGQSQGTTFKQLHGGKTLEDYVHEYIGENINIQSSTEPLEDNHTKSTLFKKSKAKDSTIAKKPDVVITGSGNLGNIWINRFPKRAKYEDIIKTFPNLIDNLINTKGIGILIMMSGSGPICISKAGFNNLKTKKITGQDPLSIYSEVDKSAINRLCNMKTAPDIAVISSFNSDTGEVHAFEELVGNHGGLGGWQTEAILLHPKHLTIPKKFEDNGKINGAVTIHKIFKHWISSAK